MPKIIITIEKVDNGYIITYPAPAGIGTYSDVAEMREPCRCRALITALYTAIEGLGDIGTKHDTHRVSINCKCKVENDEC